jgi:hypothetical protein
VVAIDVLKLFVVVAIDVLKLFVVVAMDDDISPIELEIDELNVEYPVVPVMLTCTLPEITLSLSNFDLIVVLMEEVKLFKLPDDVSSDETLPSLLDVYDWNVVSFNFPVPIGSPFSEIDPVILTAPVIDVSMFTLNPSGDKDALIDPVDICDRFKPVTPEA